MNVSCLDPSRCTCFCLVVSDGRNGVERGKLPLDLRGWLLELGQRRAKVGALSPVSLLAAFGPTDRKEVPYVTSYCIRSILSRIGRIDVSTTSTWASWVA